MRQLIKSKGVPKYTVWVKDRTTGRWYGWGQVHTPDDHLNLLEDINSGKYFNSNYTDKPDFVEIQYLPNDGNHNPNNL